MENIVPGTLRRLRAADIIRMAGLTTASLGQEHCRTGAVHNTQRQETRISGVVDLFSRTAANDLAGPGDGNAMPYEEVHQHRYSAEIELQSHTAWVSTCSCGTNSIAPAHICVHVATLLYQWLARPATFLSATAHPLTAEKAEERAPTTPAAKPPLIPASADDTLIEIHPAMTKVKPITLGHNPLVVEDLVDILTQLGLSDLRGIAREYGITTNGMNKQQLAQAIVEALGQPETVRRVAATLEKPQRQLLASLTLAGGAMTDDDLRGVYERFGLGKPAQFQSILLALQGKALLFRTRLQSVAQQRLGLSGSMLDIGWFVPQEVQTALRVTVPVTPYDLPPSTSSNEEVHIVQQAEPFHLLCDLLLVARVLDGYQLDAHDKWLEPSNTQRLSESISVLPRISGVSNSNGSVSVPAPPDLPSPTLIAMLATKIERPLAFLHFAVRLLQLADIFHRDDNGSPYLRILPNTAQLLLGPARLDVARDLFELWLTQSSYEELFALQEEGLHLRCRSTSLNIPALRPGELGLENSEARQSLVALLAQAPLKQWISFPAFARFVYRLIPTFLQRRQRLLSTPHWWLELDEGRPLHPFNATDWSRAEIHYLSRLILGPLQWWGICDTILSQDARLLAFRLTPIAGWLFHGMTLEVENAGQDYHQLANMLEIVDNEEMTVACSPQTWPLIELLEQFTEVAGVREDRLCYRLTAKVLGDALSRSQRPTKLLELLRSIAAHATRADDPLLRILARLECWIANYGRMRLYTGVTLLETVDPLVMRELAATTSLNEQIVQPIHQTLLIVKKSGTEQLIDELKRRGQTPLMHDEEFYGAE